MKAGAPDAVVLPVYNEGGAVRVVIDSVRHHYSGRIIVVDDGSTDETARALAKQDGIEVIVHEKNMGYGRSLIDGFAAALDGGAESVVTMDCDGQHEPMHIPEFLAALESCDIVSGSRYMAESPVAGAAPPARKEVNRRVTEVVNALTGWSITDAFCGFKAYRASALRAMRLTEPGYGMPLELWAQAYRRGLRVRELPVARIYFDGERSFGQELDDPEHRLGYYLAVWERALAEGA